MWIVCHTMHVLNPPGSITLFFPAMYEGVSSSFRTGRLQRVLQMVQLSATRCSCIAILWVSLVNFAAITLCISSQRVIIIVVYFVIDSVWKLQYTLVWYMLLLVGFVCLHISESGFWIVWRLEEAALLQNMSIVSRDKVVNGATG
jgi:hypothetical protein